MLNWIGKLKPLKKQKSTFLFLPRTFGQLKRGLNWLLRWILWKVGDLITFTAGVIRNETLVFVNFWAQDASILKISVPIIKRRSWGFQNTPNLQNSDYLSQVIAIERKLKFSKIGLIDWFVKAVFVPLRFLLFSQPKLMRKLISGGVSESSGSPLVDGHRDF